MSRKAPAPPPPPAEPFVRRAPFGPAPWIVGCVGEPALLRECAAKAPDFCDLLEVRIDLLNAGGPDSQIPGAPPPDPALGMAETSFSA